MLFLRFWNYIRGYVIIIIEGFFLEKFLNICTHRQIFLWDIKRCEKNKMTLKMSIKAFRCIRPVARKTRCCVRIAKKRGLPFVFHRYRGRKAFIFGAVFFILFIYTLTSFVWVVDISGNKRLETGFLQERLCALGIKPGALKYKIDTEKIVNEMMLQIGDLSWISLSVKGTRVLVEVRERVTPPPLVPKDKPCDIVAAKDGVIKSMIVKDGIEAVKEGDTVTAGQVLISGTIPNMNQEGKLRQVHALGTVTARTWYESRFPVNTSLIEKERTGKIKNNYSLVLFGKTIKLFHGKVSFQNYDSVEVKKGLSIGKDLVLPFGVVIDKYYENNVYERELDLEEAKQMALDCASKEAAGLVPPGAVVVNTNQSFVQEDEGQTVAVVTVECLEEIGIAKEIQ